MRSHTSPATLDNGDLLFEVINRRYREKSIIRTTNKVFTDWGDVSPSSSCVVTMVDRLIHTAEFLKIEADSYRLKEAKEREAEEKAKRRRKRSEKPKEKEKCSARRGSASFETT